MTAAEVDYDALVVGARVAGSVAAAFLGGQGRRVLLVDKAGAGASTVSTHFFRGGGLGLVLQALGLIEEIHAIGTPRLVRQWNYSDGEGTGSEGGPQDPGDLGYCLSVRRAALDPLLAGRAAQEASVDYLPRTTLEVLVENDGRLSDALLAGPDGELAVRARVVIGADGRRSSVARLVDAPLEEQEEGHRCLFYRYVKGWTSPDGGNPDAAEFSQIDDELAYIFPSDAGWTCVAVSVSAQRGDYLKADLATRFDALMQGHGGLAPRLERCTQPTRMFGGPTGANFVRQAAGPGWLLVGDAGQHQDPFSGVGMDLAGTTAVAAVRHIGAWLDGECDEESALAAWAAERDSIGRETWRSTVEASRDLRAA